MSKNGSDILDVLNGFDRNEVIDTIQALNNTNSVTYNAQYLKNKMILKDLKKKKESAFAISVSTLSTVLIIVIICLLIFAIRKRFPFKNKNKGNHSTRYKKNEDAFDDILQVSLDPLNSTGTSALTLPDIEEADK